MKNNPINKDECKKNVQSKRKTNLVKKEGVGWCLKLTIYESLKC